MTGKLLTEHHLEFLSLKGGCTGFSESIHVKMPHCWKSHVAAHFCNLFFHFSTPLTDITDPSIIKVPIPRKKSRRIQHQTHSKASLVRWMGDGSNPVFASLPHIR